MIDQVIKSSLVAGFLLLLWWLTESWWVIGGFLATRIGINVLAYYSWKRYKQRFTHLEDDWRSIKQVIDQQPVGAKVMYGNMSRPDRIVLVKHLRFPSHLMVNVWDIDVEENASGSYTVVERFYSIDPHLPFIHTEMLGGFLIDAQGNVVTRLERRKSNTLNRKAHRTLSSIPNSEEVADLASWFKDAEVIPS